MTKSNSLSSSFDACKYLSRFKAALIIKTEQDIRYVLETAVRITKSENKSRLEGKYVLMSIIIYFLQRREHTINEIIEKLTGIDDVAAIKDVVIQMEQKGQVIKIEGNYRIAPNIGDLLLSKQKNLGEF